VRLLPDTPILSSLIAELASARDQAHLRAIELEQLLADVEALHEPDSNGDCPTCLAPAPCVTHLLIRGRIGLDQAYAVVRDHQPIDLVAIEETRPKVPSLASLLEKPSPSLDRFFDALLRNPAA
jgi:hypothetical protein